MPDFSAILSRSWELTKRNRWLWVYGLVLAILGVSFGQGGSGLSGGSPDKLLREIPLDFPEKAFQVLGQSFSFFQEWLRGVSLTTWIILGIVIFLFILFAIILNLVIENWAKGSLIAGLAKADEGQIPTLLNTSPQGIAALKNLIIYGLIATGVSFLAILILLILFLIPGLLISILNNQLVIFWIIFSFVIGGLSLILLFVLLAMINIYAERLIVLRYYPPWQAWKKGLGLSKGNFLPTMIMGMINRIIGCSVGCLGLIAFLIFFGIPVIIVLLPSFKNGLHLPGLPTLLFVFFLFLILLYANYLIRAAFLVFNYSNWNLLFKEALVKEDANGKQG